MREYRYPIHISGLYYDAQPQSRWLWRIKALRTFLSNTLKKLEHMERLSGTTCEEIQAQKFLIKTIQREIYKLESQAIFNQFCAS